MNQLLSSILVLCAFLAAAAGADSRPHIVFVLTDDMGSGDLGCYGGNVVATPQIDRMAREGTRFTSYYTASPICSPSRCGLITGQFPARWNITSFLQTRAGNRACEQRDYLAADAPSLPRTLREAGYATAHIGKWHLGGGRDVVDPPKFAAYGYDEGVGTYESPEPHPDITSKDWIWGPDDKVKRWDRTAFFVDKTLDFIERHKDGPCFVNLWLDDPHTPWVPGPEELRRDTRPNLKRVLEENDRQIGRLLDGLPENALVIYASDNGAGPTLKRDRTLGLRGGKLSLYEAGMRVPFIVRWPGKVPAARVDETTVITAVDLFPTLCAIAKATLPDGYKGDGEDMSRALLGTEVERTKPIFWEYGRNPKSFKFPAGAEHRSPNVAMREGSWKFLVNSDGSVPELYDVRADPGETRNLVAAQPEIAERMKRAALERRASLPKFDGTAAR